MEKCGTTDIKTFKKNQLIFAQGDASDCMYDIRQGSVGIYAGYGTPGETLLTELLEGDYFGEMGLLDTAPRSATAIALEKDTRVEVITPETFGSYFEEKPHTVILMMRSMTSRIRDLTEDYISACRAVSEAVENEGQKKSDWFISRVQGFMDDFKAGRRRGEESK